MRDVQYKYSKLAQERFLADSDLSFLMVWFHNHADYREFMASKLVAKEPMYQ